MKINVIVILFLLASCYGVNERTSHICNFNTTCVKKDAWAEIFRQYPVSEVSDSIWLLNLKKFKDQVFPSDVLYFAENPRELIGIDQNHSSVRYVYNPLISDQILDGLSPQLNAVEKKRIAKRIQTIVMQYQCEKGKNESLMSIDRQNK